MKRRKVLKSILGGAILGKTVAKTVIAVAPTLVEKKKTTLAPGLFEYLEKGNVAQYDLAATGSIDQFFELYRKTGLAPIKIEPTWCQKLHKDRLASK